MGTERRIRIRHPSGSSTILVPLESTNGDVARLIEQAVTAMTPLERQLWKTNYPPRPMPRCSALDPFFGKDQTNKVDMIHVSLVQPREATTCATVSFETYQQQSEDDNNNKECANKVNDDRNDEEIRKPPSHPPSLTDPDGFLVKRAMDANNSCLFHSIAYVLMTRNNLVNDATVTTSKDDNDASVAMKLRQMVAQAVRDDPIQFSEAFLGKSPKEYISFISNPSAWGGQIELHIFSNLFQTEIAACDVTRNCIDVYGTDQHYTRRVYVMYDGIHYDALAFVYDLDTAKQTNAMDVTQFAPHDDCIYEKAISICNQQHAQKAYTDTSSFTLRCLVCQKGLTGASEAQTHAQATGHGNFAEF